VKTQKEVTFANAMTAMKGMARPAFKEARVFSLLTLRMKNQLMNLRQRACFWNCVGVK